MQTKTSEAVAELRMGDHVRRTDTDREGSVVTLHASGHMARVQFDSNSGEEDWVSTALLTRIPNGERRA